MAQNFCFFVFILGLEGSDQISNVLFVFDWLDVRVVQNKSKMALDLGHSFDLVVFTKSFSHDSN